MFNLGNTHEKKLGTTKYSWDKVSEARNLHEKKFWTYETTMRKSFGPTNYQPEKISDTQSHNGMMALDPL